MTSAALFEVEEQVTPSVLRTEADVIASLAGRAVTLDELYAACQDAGVTARDGGLQSVGTGHGADTVWRRRVRGALQSLKRAGRAEHLSKGTWVIDGTRDQPRRALLLWLPGEPGLVELQVAEACEFLNSTDEPFDLVLADPPYGLAQGVLDDPDRDKGERAYARDGATIVAGYREAPSDPDGYADFSARWMQAAAAAMRPGANLAVITGTSSAWQIGYAAHLAGLNLVSQVAVQRRFALRTTRRLAFAHWVMNVYCVGPVNSKRRFFHIPPELPKAASGRDYPLDVWAGTVAPPKAERRGLLRYRNALPVPLVERTVRMLSSGPDNGGDAWSSLVADPFLGSGTTAVAALRLQRRFRGADVNVNSVRFAAARISAEECR